MKRVGVLPVALVLAAGSAHAQALPDCAGPLELEKVHIVRVEYNNDVLVLRDGRAIHMEGIRIPHASRDRAPAYPTDQAYDAIVAMAKGHSVSAAAVVPKEDRYDRVRGQVINDDGVWMQMALLKRGLARVDIAPDRTECAAELYAAESDARAANAGLWALPAYRVRAPEQLGGDAGTFQIVQGRVLTADVKDGRAYLDFGPDWRTDFTVTVAPDDMANFRAMGVDPRDYAGKTIRVRGIIQQFNGPEIEVANPKQVEVLP
ncbi:MAG TPA: thermonuclease family protein [Rhizomicrobium sp.]|jgi:endonuclease YncB( thermonuclease family)|nr:thermonuclease family protein [Rhizomicrobium sp.]